MLAIYHSHPETPARPSEEDIRLALTPDVVYIIISVAEPTPVIKGFYIEDNNVTEVHLTIER
jgi:proteasome lid subunit RPN8/RPN11